MGLSSIWTGFIEMGLNTKLVSFDHRANSLQLIIELYCNFKMQYPQSLETFLFSMTFLFLMNEIAKISLFRCLIEPPICCLPSYFI